MSSPFLGQIKIYAFNFAPKYWAMCNGQQLAIAQNQALFSLLGTTYGGNGITTFALPDLRGRFPVGFGQGPGLTNIVQGQVGGTATTTIIPSEMPPHNHVVNASTNASDLSVPTNNYFGSGPQAVFKPAPADVLLDPSALSATSGGLPHENMPPYLTLNFCIALSGIFPSRN